MDAHEAAERLLEIVNRRIDQAGYAMYWAVRNDLATEAGEEWIAPGKRNHRNISPEVQAEFRKLPGWQSLTWNAPRQRWTRKPSE